MRGGIVVRIVGRSPDDLRHCRYGRYLWLSLRVIRSLALTKPAFVIHVGAAFDLYDIFKVDILKLKMLILHR